MEEYSEPYVDLPSFKFGQWLSHPPPGEEVVITGMAGRFPESDNVDEFANNLLNKRDMIIPLAKHWLHFKHPETPKHGGIINNITKFDSGHFGLHWRQAHTMDPMIRILMEHAVESIMDAGIHPAELEGSKTGVFLAITASDIEKCILQNITEPQQYAYTGFLRSMAAHRVSYFLKLKGPSFTADTACSSSLNALEHAFKAIRTGQCENAIVCGGNVIMHPGSTIQFFRLGVLSPKGTSKVFDDEADGYVRSESVGCILLQKAKFAKRIYGQLIYGKINHDGYKKEGITFPSVRGQSQLMKECYFDCGIKSSELSFIEAHATGTKVGDPQEIYAIDETLAKNRKEPLWIGSVKSNIGHTEVCSGVISIIKVLIAMETGFVAPNINLEKPKDVKPFKTGRIKVATDKFKIEDDEAIVGVNNFGFGGNNCHVILRRISKIKNTINDDLPRLVCVSGRTHESVQRLLDDLVGRNLNVEYVGLLHQLFKMDFNTHLYRGYAILSKSGPIKTSVNFYQRQNTPFCLIFGEIENFELLAKDFMNLSIFKSTISKLSKDISVFKNNYQVKEKILTSIAFQIGVADVLKVLEITPQHLYGQSYGKIICAYFDEVITLQEALRLALKIAQLPSESRLHEDSLHINQEQIRSKRSSRHFSETLLTKTEKLSDDFGQQYDFKTIPENCIVLNFMRDSRLNKIDKFLETIGRLYEHGHNPQIHKLYTEIKFPVSRGTPTISSLVEWKHDYDWFTYKFCKFETVESEQQEYIIRSEKEDKYVTGHVIDGRNLYPATGYLYLVWNTLACSKKLLPIDIAVVFENCKFIRATTVPPNDFIKLFVTIQRESGNFEVLEGDSLVVSGRISIMEQDFKLPDEPNEILTDYNPKTILTHDEIYKELYLRGYNYKGQFKGLMRCNLEATKAMVKWEDNWITLLDNILQIKILQSDTRNLYVPTAVRRLSIDPVKFLATVKTYENQTNIPIYSCKVTDSTRAPGIEVKGVNVSSIARRKLTAEPVLEKYQFIPNTTLLSLNDSLRINTQIILENSLESTVKAVELIDDFTKNTSKPLLPLISEILDDVPLVKPDLTISSKTPIDDAASIKTEDVVLTPQSKFLWILGSKLLQRQVILQQAINALKENGFILTREEKDFYPNNYEEIDVITQHTLGEEKLILLRRKNEIREPTVIEISSQNFDWLPLLQTAIKTENNVLIYSQNQPLDGILGLINCIGREPEGRKVKCFFIVDEAPTFNLRDTFYKDQIEKGFAINVYKNGEWGTYRHLLLQEDTNEVEREHCYVNVTTRGNLSSLRWLEGPLTLNSKLSDDKILINVYYAALNFRDIMTATGRLNVDVVTLNRLEQQCIEGFEFSGRDPSGKKVMGLLVGGGFSTLVASDPYLTFPVPDEWSLEDAATVPVVYYTVIYGLLQRTTLKPGSSILIHSGTGGIGLAAINVALYYNCKIYTTVGTAEKRQFLKSQFPQLQDSNIGNSRDLSFETMIMKETSGRGVDVVLNSLVGEKLMASLRCLARGGKFVEIGKFDLMKDSKIKLLLMEKGASFHGIMLDSVFTESNKVKQQIKEELTKFLKSSMIKPLPRIVFQKEEIEKAFRYMTTGKHTGKVLIQIRNEETEKIIKSSKEIFKCIPRFCCHSDKVQIIIGGLGGIGLELADWMVLRGTKQLVLVSRTGLQTGYQNQRISIWKSYGVSVYISTSDITTKSGCLELIKESSKLGQIDGIFNLGVVLKDALFESQTPENFTISFEPKARATQYLDEITRELCPNLRFFVVFSSVSCGRGNPGQTNYGMANSIMERICEKRREDGFPALAIQWGAIGDVGLVAKMQKDNKILEIGGTLQQKISNCFEVLDKMMGQNNVVVSSMVVAEKRSGHGGSAANAVAHILGIKDLKSINLNSTLTELGMDSITGTEIYQVLEKEFDIYVKADEMGTLTFIKLIELENNKNQTENTQSKMNHEMRRLLLFLPDSEISALPVLKIPTSIQDNDKLPTIYIIPGIEGSLNNLMETIRHLKAHVYILQYDNGNPDRTIPEMAENFLSLIETNLKKDEPFNIIGYSYGTIIATELILLLENKGFHGRFFSIDGSYHYLNDCFHQLLPANNNEELQITFLCYMMSLVLPISTVSKNKENIIKYSNLEERLDYLMAITERNKSKQKNLEKQTVTGLYHRLKGLLQYQQKNHKIKSVMTLYRPSQPILATYDYDYKLGNLYDKPIRIIEIEGNHQTILHNVALAQDVNQILAN